MFGRTSGWKRSIALSALRLCIFIPALVALMASSANAQLPPRRYIPYTHRSQPGTAAMWSRVRSKSPGVETQPVLFALPENVGTISGYQGTHIACSEPSPAQFTMGVGFTYRLKLSNMKDFPGKELYPTVELIDRLHPPAGMENDYPVPISFSQDELEEAFAGRLVTKVIYLEQPQLAPPTDMRTESNTYTLSDKVNLIREADRRGRPMAIIRIGSRQPPAPGTDYGFYGSGGLLQPSFTQQGLPYKAARRTPAMPKSGRSFVRQAAATRPQRAPKNQSAVTGRTR